MIRQLLVGKEVVGLGLVSVVLGVWLGFEEYTVNKLFY